MCLLLFQRLRIPRHHPGGSLRLAAPQAAPQPHGLHGAAAGGAGEDLPEDPLSRCGDEGAPGHVHQPARGQSAGTSGRKQEIKEQLELYFFSKMHKPFCCAFKKNTGICNLAYILGFNTKRKKNSQNIKCIITFFTLSV